MKKSVELWLETLGDHIELFLETLSKRHDSAELERYFSPRNEELEAIESLCSMIDRWKKDVEKLPDQEESK